MPTPEQLGDYEWWQSNAPIDSTHIHLRPNGESQWMRVNLAGPFNYYWHQRFSEWQRKEAPIGGRVVPRPKSHPNDTQPSGSESQIPVEWDGEGLPPVGCECRMTLGFVEYDRVKITYMGDGVFCYRNMRNGVEYTGALSDAHFVRLRTQAERDRDELSSFLRSFDKRRSIAWCEDAADAIIAAGWHKTEPQS